MTGVHMQKKRTLKSFLSYGTQQTRVSTILNGPDDIRGYKIIQKHKAPDAPWVQITAQKGDEEGYRQLEYVGKDADGKYGFTFKSHPNEPTTPLKVHGFNAEGKVTGTREIPDIQETRAIKAAVENAARKLHGLTLHEAEDKPNVKELKKASKSVAKALKEVGGGRWATPQGIAEHEHLASLEGTQHCSTARSSRSPA